jgi:hypothetical protein
MTPATAQWASESVTAQHSGLRSIHLSHSLGATVVRVPRLHTYPDGVHATLSLTVTAAATRY